MPLSPVIIDLPTLSTIDSVKESHKDFYLKNGKKGQENEIMGDEEGEGMGLVEKMFKEVSE